MRVRKGLFVLLIAQLWLCTASVLAADEVSDSVSTWRSALYPEDWEPCFQDSQGRFLQDFSFAGYHAGERPIPSDTLTPVVDVTQPPYNADPTGTTDATAAIQAAIDAVGKQGGGTVYLPPGTYALSVPAHSQYALGIPYNNVRLIGAGPDQTYLRLDTQVMRFKSLIHVYGEGDWDSPLPNTTQYIATDLTYPTQIIPVQGKPRFDVGDWVVLTHDTTQEWVDEHNMSDLWGPNAIQGSTFYRQVIAVDDETNTITIDAPIRYYLLPRDRARVYKVGPHVEEVGLANFSIGMVEHPGDGWGGEDYAVRGTGAWDVHDATAIRFVHAVNSWVENVHTYRPEGNDQAHILSIGIWLDRSRYITIRGVEISNPQYLGGGGNGYPFQIRSNDVLITHSAATNGRHNFTFLQGYANGNVITSSFFRGIYGSHSDFHRHLSPSNLVDRVRLEQDRIDAGWRADWGTIPHGLTTTQTVIWNTRGERYGRYPSIVYSEQYGWGYVIGTQGPASGVLLGQLDRTLPVDYAEGVGLGEYLEPQSLYTDQLARRMKRGGIIHCPELDFRPQIPTVNITSPRAGEVVTGEVTIKLEVELPDGSPVEELAVMIDGQPLHVGDPLSELSFDTRTLADGAHELVVRAVNAKGRVGEASVSFSVSNWYTMTDHLQPPLSSGHFGTLDRLRTSSRTDGWEYATESVQHYFGDADRLVRSGNSEEYLVWEAPQLQAFRIVLYATDPTVVPHIMFELSGDQAEWVAAEYGIEIEGPNAGGVHRISIAGQVSTEAKWFRLRIPKGTVTDAGLQIGLVELRGRR